MSRIYRDQKEYEQFLIREFVRERGWQISRPEWRDRPDALLTLTRGSTRKRVAIEHTDYYRDVPPGRASPIAWLEEFWRLVKASLTRRISHRPNLADITATICFKDDLTSLPRTQKDRQEVARCLAAELVDFARQQPLQKESRRYVRHFDTDCYPLLSKCVSCVGLHKTGLDGMCVRQTWVCVDVTTGGTTLVLDYVKLAIERKTKKANLYSWGNAQEKWLLITAAAKTISNMAGSRESVNWDRCDLQEACSNSPFDRILFWERSQRWCKEIWP